MKITALAENTSRDPDIGAEHGLSLYIETNSYTVLFDMGQTGLFAENAEKLGKDLSAVDFAVLSHGHYDHGGGMELFLRLNGHAPVYINRRAFEPHYNASGKYIGLNVDLLDNKRIILTDEEFRIADGFTLYSCNSRPKTCEIDPGGLTVMKNGKIVPEDFTHEQYLLIEEDGKRVLISGCSHKGVLNIAEWFRPDVLVGGFHYMKRNLDDKLIDSAKKLNSFPTRFCTCHCTGTEQYDFKKPHMERLSYISCGETVCI